MADSLVFHCPNCQEPIGSLRPYVGPPKGRRKGASDNGPRKERGGDLNAAITNALADLARGMR